eukprot:Gregarina_sp_Poly_1__6793@NODE_366_length_9175_cov_311_049627_g302_i0_p2_GENE_NODE_366_length_9175_cov_311_049627_g302_i0NODE_366_length_9175_cov_311_049627_g302_i0_p2_ORF_typecomplete_len512_score70_44Lipase_3/PF01764_25/2_2e03Lipase_3/PF01764_25/3_5e25DUF2974/PF11187_8/9_3e08Hydrolase_4/PF12146_8/0_0029Chlorophyllase2/PF12740_7/0_0028BAAT_C/PF08840_11/0_019DUF818/PF05677_12/0_025LIDHydrolase/PF10230_9/0_02Esterase/PF00756_20/0_025DUF900/PF05990_12/0_077DUF676/PF05057_14/0_084Abhydrolase_3/PF07
MSHPLPLNWLIKTIIEFKVPGSERVWGNLDPILSRLSNLNPFFLVAAAKLWAQLQRICGRPYVPKFETDWVLTSEKNRIFFSRIQHYFRLACYVYKATHIVDSKIPQQINGKLTIEFPNLNIVHVQKETIDGIPGHCIAVDDERKEIVLAIRGSAEPADWVINLVCGPTDSGAHQGMHETALALEAKVVPVLQKLLQTHPFYNIILTGHSLGAGISVLMALHFQSRNMFCNKLQAVGFATPVVIREDVANNCKYKENILNVVLGRDIVCHGGLKAVHIYTQLLSQMTSLMTMGSHSIMSRLHLDSESLLDDEDSTSSTSASPMSESSAASRSSSASSAVKSSISFPIPIQDLIVMADKKCKELDSQLEANLVDIPSSDVFFRILSRRVPPKKGACEDPVVPVESVYWDCLNILEREWSRLGDDLETGNSLCIPGTIVHVIPREHLRKFQCRVDVHDDLFVNDCVFVRLPVKQNGRFCSECCLHIAALSDHLIGSYAAALIPEEIIPQIPEP